MARAGGIDAEIQRRVRSWLGPEVFVGSGRLDPAHLQSLWPQERAHVERAVLKRQTEFATARVLARKQLEAMGCEPMPLVPRADRSPTWPNDAVGSITHSSEHCVVLCAKKNAWRSVGVDLERVRAFSAGMVEMVLTPREREELGELEDPRTQQRCVQVFCLKEAFYKFQSPLTGLFLDFLDVELVQCAAEQWTIGVAPDAHPRAAQAFSILGARGWQLHSDWLDPLRVFAVASQRAVGVVA